MMIGRADVPVSNLRELIASLKAGPHHVEGFAATVASAAAED